MDTTQQTIDVVISKKTDLEEKLLKVAQIQTYTMTEDDQHVTLHCTIDCPTPELIAGMVHENFAIHQVTPTQSELEQIFLSLTGGSQ